MLFPLFCQIFYQTLILITKMRLIELTGRTRLRGGSVALGSCRGVVQPAMFPRFFTIGTDTRYWCVLGAHVETALAVIAVVQRPRGLLAGLGDVRV